MPAPLCLREFSAPFRHNAFLSSFSPAQWSIAMCVERAQAVRSLASPERPDRQAVRTGAPLGHDRQRTQARTCRTSRGGETPRGAPRYPSRDPSRVPGGAARRGPPTMGPRAPRLVRFLRRPCVRQVFWGATLGFAIACRRHRRAVVAAFRWPDRIRLRDALAESGNRGQFRRQSFRLSRRHPDRA